MSEPTAYGKYLASAENRCTALTIEQLLEQRTAELETVKDSIAGDCKRFGCRSQETLDVASREEELTRELVSEKERADRLTGELAEAKKTLKLAAKMLRRGQKACEREGWEKGESAEAWCREAGGLAAQIEINSQEEY